MMVGWSHGVVKKMEKRDKETNERDGDGLRNTENERKKEDEGGI